MLGARVPSEPPLDLVVSLATAIWWITLFVFGGIVSIATPAFS